jgi:hypothetical protein
MQKTRGRIIAVEAGRDASERKGHDSRSARAVDGRSPEKIPMTESDTKPRPGLRLITDFQFFDHDGSHMWRSYRAGDAVSDEKEIAWLVAIGAPVEEAIYRR